MVELRHDLPGVSVQDPRPVKWGEAIGQALRARKLADEAPSIEAMSDRSGRHRRADHRTSA
jgi:hypothetical protein